jgi:phosphoribosylglycinamide formyltransferase 1
VNDSTRQTLVVLASDDGAELLRLIDAIARGQVAARIALVITDSRGSRAQDRAEDHGIPTLYHPFDWYTVTGRSTTDYDHDLAETIARYAPDWVLLSGWERPLSPALTARFQTGLLAAYLAVS